MSDDDTVDTIAGWQKIMEMVRKCNLSLTLPDNLENLVNSRRELTKQLKEFSENVRTQENIACFLKGVCAAGTIIGAGLTFSPYFPLGVGITAVSSAVLNLVNLVDWIAEKWKKHKLDKMLEKDQELTELFINDMKKLDFFCKYFLREKITTSRDEGDGIAISTLMFEISVATFVSSTIALWKPLKDIFSNGIICYMWYTSERLAWFFFSFTSRHHCVECQRGFRY